MGVYFLPSYLRVRGAHACAHVRSCGHASANGFLRRGRVYASEGEGERQYFRHPVAR